MEKNKLVKYDFLKLQKIGSAIAITRKLLQKNAEEYFESALQKGQSGKYEDAISDYTKAIQLDPTYTIAFAHRYTLLGMKYYSEDNFEDAKACFLKTIELIDENYSYIKLISLYLQTEELENAMKYSEIAISLFADESSLYLMKGQINTLLGLNYDAINDFTTAIEIEWKKEVRTDVCHEAFLERAKSKKEVGNIIGSEEDYITMNALQKAWRVRHEGVTDEEKKVFGIK